MTIKRMKRVKKQVRKVQDAKWSMNVKIEQNIEV